MSKVISQDTFDEVVKENVIDFSMTPSEAKEETIKQFEAQGINLANIIKDLAINNETGRPIINETLDKIKAHISQKSEDTQQLLELITVLDLECQKSLAHRVLAGKNGAHDALITLLEQTLQVETEINTTLLCKCLQAANSLSQKQPDLFDAEALSIVLKLLALQDQQLDVTCLTLQWLQKACVMHEMNRQNIISSNLLKLTKPLLRKDNPRVVRELTAVLRFLVLDDDIRVEFGCAHEHARQIANELLLELVQLLPEYEDVNVLSDLLLTIGTLAVRQELCTLIDDAGGLKLIFDIMKANLNQERLNREALKLLRALAGHDAVKAHIVQQGVAPIIKELLETHQANENIVSAALACITTLTLRVQEHSAAFFETGIAEIIVETLRRHPKHKIVQRNGAWAIRNMVSRSRNQCESWLSFGVEDLLNAAMVEHPSVAQDIKAALRDLGCNVQLREEWTGKAEKKIAA
ncbi:armadillo repeat-containing protein 6 homolog [Drosophila sulfurigaster albostrigata]|uniref:armadillo repeat-containing protein 6 homolog n=1 Tax=Drosophila sulfurigaster albostrigata TaxID=89887 RepID=UPI002D21B321|nr:armadillo repeat-containing protein 6 homolog [Drosophila sulfurigaster albostrigata]